MVTALLWVAMSFVDVHLLAHDDFPVRLLADRRLRERGFFALPALLTAGGDPERVWRARAISQPYREMPGRVANALEAFWLFYLAEPACHRWLSAGLQDRLTGKSPLFHARMAGVARQLGLLREEEVAAIELEDGRTPEDVLSFYFVMRRRAWGEWRRP